MSDSDDDGLAGVAKNCLEQLLGISAKLLPDSGGTLSEEGEAVVASGKLVASSINRALTDLGQFAVNPGILDDSVQELLFLCQVHFHASGTGKAYRQLLLDYQITAAALDKELQKEWNTALPLKLKKLPQKQKKRLEDTDHGQSSSKCHDSSPKKMTHTTPTDEALPKPQKRKLAETNEGESSPNGPNYSTPKKNDDTLEEPLKKRKIHKLTPKQEMLSSFDCHVCDKSYNWLKALKKHVKEKHPTESVPAGLKEISDVVTCKICSCKHQRNLIMRHLRTVHGVQNKSGKVFRGFQTEDDGVTWKPLFLRKGEDTPCDRSLEVSASDEGSKDVKLPVFGSKEASLRDCNAELLQDEFVKDGELEDNLMMVECVDKTKNDETVDLEVLKDADVLKVADQEDCIVRVGSVGQRRDEGTSSDKEIYADKEIDDDEEIDDDREVDDDQEVVDDEEIDELDEDHEKGDTEEFSRPRMEMKRLRYARRNQVENSPKAAEVEGNVKIIQEFEAFVSNQNFATATKPEKLSTIKKEVGHLFYYEDSMLEYMTKSVPNYLLDKHFEIGSEKFLEVRDPKDWIDSSGGPSGKQKPSRRKEQLKAHAKFREFVKEKLEASPAHGGSLENMLKKELVLKQLDKIGMRISTRQTFTQLSRLETQERLERQKAKEILNPSHSFNEMNCVEVWFKSLEACKEEEACMKIWAKAMDGKKIGSREFTRFASFCRFTISLEDKNRRSVYGFSNKDFQSRIKKWLPEPGNETEQIELLPESWNPDIPPDESTEPSCWIIKLTGTHAGLKGGRPADLILTRRAHELCLKFQDLKQTIWSDDEVQDDSMFFVNFKGESLAPMQRTKGSLFQRFSKVTGVTNPTLNTVRRGVESKIQSDPKLKSRVENLQSHSGAVGLTYYDKSGTNVRASFIDQLANKESPVKVTHKIPEDVKKKREEKERKDNEKNLEAAKKMLIMDTMRKNTRLSSKCKLLPQDKKFLQLLFSNSETGEIFHALNGFFPGDQSWKRYFYRCVDTLAGTDGDHLREIEEKSFAHIFKKEVEAELGPWTGSAEQNRLADYKIAGSVKNSFKNYEKNKKEYEQSYFKF